MKYTKEILEGLSEKTLRDIILIQSFDIEELENQVSDRELEQELLRDRTKQLNAQVEKLKNRIHYNLKLSNSPN